jgi:hypothetical protein
LTTKLILDLEDLVQFDLKISKKFPAEICSRCEKKLDEFCAFKQTVIKTQKIFSANAIFKQGVNTTTKPSGVPVEHQATKKVIKVKEIKFNPPTKPSFRNE